MILAMKTSLIYFILTIISLLSFAQGSLTQPQEKKCKNIIEKVFNKTGLQYNTTQDKDIQRIVSNNKTIGYYSLMNAKGKICWFKIIIIYSSDLTIKKVYIAEYNETRGGEITNPKYLSKYEGLNAKTQKPKVDAISGATISSNSLKKAIELSNKKLIFAT